MVSEEEIRLSADIPAPSEAPNQTWMNGAKDKDPEQEAPQSEDPKPVQEEEPPEEPGVDPKDPELQSSGSGTSGGGNTQQDTDEVPEEKQDPVEEETPKEDVEQIPQRIIDKKDEQGQGGTQQPWGINIEAGSPWFWGGIALAAVLVGCVVADYFRRKARKKKRKAARAAAAAAYVSGGSVEVADYQDIGAREDQQDSHEYSHPDLYAQQGLMAVVADGMGGLADGDKVSEAVVTAMMDGFFSGSEAGNILLSLAEQANRKVNQLLGPTGIGKSGSTMVAGLIREGAFHYISIGDSRICLFRDGQLMQLNREHVYQNELSVQALNGVGTLSGAVTHPKAAGLTSYLGMGQLKYVDIPAESIAIREGDKFILMSDGVYNALQKEEISAALMNDAEKAAEMIREKIAEKAYRNQDNYSAVILAC